MEINFEELDKIASTFSRIHPAAAMKAQKNRRLKKASSEKVYLLVLDNDMPLAVPGELDIEPEDQVEIVENTMLKLDLVENLDECLIYLNTHFRNYEYPYELIA